MTVTVRHVALLRRSLYFGMLRDEPVYSPPNTDEEIEEYRKYLRKTGMLDFSAELRRIGLTTLEAGHLLGVSVRKVMSWVAGAEVPKAVKKALKWMPTRT